MHVGIRLVVMLVPLMLLSGCAHRQSTKHFNKKQLAHHLTAETADVSKTINNIRISCKQSLYVKKNDCTLIHMTIDNKSNNTCSFNRSNLNISLLTQKEAEKVVKSSSVRKAARIILPVSIGLATFLAPIALLAAGGILTVASMGLLALPIGIIVGPSLTANTYFATRALIPDKKNQYDLDYIYEDNAQATICANETRSMLLLAKGPLKQNFQISLQTYQGLLDYNF